MRGRGFAFTINNPTEEDYSNLGQLKSDYLIFGKERGEEGTLHLQGYVYFKNKKEFAQLKKDLPRAHLEQAKAGHAANIVYCMKQEDYLEFGDRPIQGKRSDLDVIRYDLKKGVSEYAIANKYFSQWCQYRRAFREYRDLLPVEKTLLVVYDITNRYSIQEAAKYFGPKAYHEDMGMLNKVWFEYYSGKWNFVIVAMFTRLAAELHASDLDKKDINYIIV